MTFCGRGMLPIGSVGMVISKPRKDSGAKQALPLLTSNFARLKDAPNAARIVEKVGEERRGTDAQPFRSKPGRLSDPQSISESIVLAIGL
jgi:hypothetical protein